MTKIFFAVTISLNALVACSNLQVSGNTNQKDSISTHLDSAAFDTVINNQQVKLYFLKNKSNMQAAITNYGGRLVSLLVPDKTGHLTDVVLGHDNIKNYLSKNEGYFGALIGRYGNRIKNGRFVIGDKSYQLSLNNGPNLIHGGKNGFHAQVWQAKMIGEDALELSYTSKAMEEGFPGNLNVKVIYKLTNSSGLKISYTATTDSTTVVNLTNHAYFNLNGEGSGTILNHSLQILANQYTPVDVTLIPTGKLEDVKNTPFDFNTPKTIGKDINTSNLQLKNGKGYDHNFVLSGKNSGEMNHVAMVKGDQSGIVMDIYTKEPGLQFYSGNFMRSKNILKHQGKDDYRTAFCLETQHFPDSPNQTSFPSTLLKPGEIYKTSTVYQFSTVKE